MSSPNVSPLIHPRTKKMLCAIPVATLWLFGLATFFFLNARF